MGALNLPRRELEARREAPSHVGVLDHRAALGEVGREAEIVDAADRALDDRPHAAQQELVVYDRVVLAEQRAPVDMQHAAQLDVVRAVGRLHREALLACLDDAGRLGGRRVGFFLDLEPALEDLDGLFLLLEPLQQLLHRRLLSLCLRDRKRGDDGGGQ